MLTLPGSRRASSRTDRVAVSYRCSTERSLRATTRPARPPFCHPIGLRDTSVGTARRNCNTNRKTVGSTGGVGSVASAPYDEPGDEHPGQADARRHRGALGGPVGRRGHLPLRRSAPREDVFSIDTPPPTVSGSLHMGHVFSYTHTDIDRPLPADVGQGRLLPDGLGRQRPAHRAPRAELLRRALRSRPSTTSRGSSRRSAAIPRRTTTPCRSRGRTSSNCATNSSNSTSRSSRICFKRLGLSVDWNHQYATIDEHSRRTQPARVPAQPRPRRGLQPGGADAVGRRLPHRRRPGGDGGPRAPGRLPQDRVRTAPTAAAAVTIEIDTTRPELLAACVALVAHPDDERYQPLFGTTVRTPAVRRRGADRRPRTRPARQGHRHRDDLHVRRHHRRHLVARAEPADACRSSGATAASSPRPPTASTPRRTPRSPGSRSSRRRRQWSSSSSPPDCCSASPGRSSTRSSSTSAATARSRSSRPGSGTSATVVATPTCGRRSWLAAARSRGIPPTCSTATTTGSRASTATGSSAASGSSACPFPVWYPLDEHGEPRYDDPLLPAESRLPIDPSTDTPDGLRRSPARRARRLHRRPRHHRHLGDVVAHPADRRTLGGGRRPVRPRVPDGHAAAGPRHHPHLAVLHDDAQPPRARLRAVEARCAVGLDPRPRPQEDVEVEGQRRHAAGPVRAATAPTPCATGRVRAAPASTPPSARTR